MVSWGLGAVFKKYCIYAKPVTSHHSHNSTISSSYFTWEVPSAEWTLPCLSQVWSWNLQPGQFHTSFHSTVYQLGGKVGSSMVATSHPSSPFPGKYLFLPCAWAVRNHQGFTVSLLFCSQRWF